MKLNLWPVAWKTSLAGGVVGTMVHGYLAIFVREAYSPLVEPWGIVLGGGIGGFWVLVWIVTPGRWWA